MSNIANAVAAMDVFEGSEASILRAVSAADAIFTEELDATDGQFLMTLVGVADDPFSVSCSQRDNGRAVRPGHFLLCAYLTSVIDNAPHITQPFFSKGFGQ